VDDVIAMVMAGGMGERLRPLTDTRAKPAIPFGGIYRIIDFALSSCLNSGIRRVFVLTQYKSHSLSSHLKAGFGFLSRRLNQFIDEIPAQMQMGSHWYKGTADAIRQNVGFLAAAKPRLVLILAGDHIYKMDFRAMRRFHEEHGGCCTVGAVRVDPEVARGNLGTLEIQSDGRVTSFVEKPADPQPIAGTTQCLASMGIYLFNYDGLNDCLLQDYDDFGQHVIPAMLAKGLPVYAFDFNARNHIQEYEFSVRDGQRVKTLVARASDSDYWRDVGTLDSYWYANLDLVAPSPRFNLYGERWPLFSYPEHFPPAKFVHDSVGRVGQAHNSIVCDGVIISGATVKNSILSPGIYVHSYSLIESSVLMGGAIVEGGIITETAIGRRCRIKNAIIDKSVTLSEGTIIGYDRIADEARGLKTHPIGDGDYIVVVPKRAVL
jgi:glucose-1-phosphate adenylyltransferase